MTDLHCSQMGDAAGRLLVPGIRGRVLASFSQAVYLVTEEAELFWLAARSAPMHARAVCTAASLPRLAAGTAFAVLGQRIVIGGSLGVDLAAASTWSAPTVGGPATTALHELPSRLQPALAADPDPSSARGLGRLIPEILALVREERAALPAGTEPVLARARPAIDAIARALLHRDLSALWQPADALLGLGDGLTPSGDDFLSALLFCLHSLDKLDPELALDLSGLSPFIESGRRRTNLISYTLLVDAAGGQAVEPLHGLLRAVCSHRPAAGIRQAAVRLTHIGHSTGWDLLAGAVTGLVGLSGHAARG